MFLPTCSSIKLTKYCAVYKLIYSLSSSQLFMFGQDVFLLLSITYNVVGTISLVWNKKNQTNQWKHIIRKQWINIYFHTFQYETFIWFWTGSWIRHSRLVMSILYNRWSFLCLSCTLNKINNYLDYSHELEKWGWTTLRFKSRIKAKFRK